MNKKTKKPYEPVSYVAADVSAAQAFVDGNADEFQQKRLFKWLIEASGYYELSYQPDSSRDTDFMEGRRFVGAQLLKLTKLNASYIANRENNAS
tara:strand:+ start:218 stop:499 length:282 start_codon:yes stop_codon:yes gene_type:complete